MEISILHFMQFDVVIPTIGNERNLEHIFLSIAQQTVLPERIHIVLVGYSGSLKDLVAKSTAELPEFLIGKIQWHAIQPLKEGEPNGSYPRNYGVENSTSEYVYLIDDDNVFEATFFAKSIADYVDFSKRFQKAIVYSPTINWRYTSTIQSRGMRAFHFALGWPEPVQFGGWKSRIVNTLRWIFRQPSYVEDTNNFVRVQAIGGNSLLAPKKLFKEFLFNEKMAFVYEDIDVTYRMTKAGVPLIVSKVNHIYHMERTKTKLEQSFLANAMGAYQKAKNRIIFVKKNGNVFQRIVFFCIGLPITSLMTMCFILIRGGEKRWEILQGYWKGIIKGL